jgi:hypothetical protein
MIRCGKEQREGGRDKYSKEQEIQKKLFTVEFYCVFSISSLFNW